MVAMSGDVIAGKYNQTLDVGDQTPSWNDLIGADDKPHSLDDLKKAKAVVVVFTCNHCPIAVIYEDRIIEFTKMYKEKGVALVAINVNKLPADRLDKMKVRAEEKGFSFPYLYDPTQQIGRDYGATVTPHCFVLDAKRTIAYMGAFDDNMLARKVKKQHVRDAVDALLAGRRPEMTEVQQIGCNIEYETQ